MGGEGCPLRKRGETACAEERGHGWNLLGVAEGQRLEGRVN